MHDKFHAVLPDGYGFDFIIEKKGNRYDYTVSGSRSVKISHIYYANTIQSFTVTDEDGVIYTFSEGDTPFRHGQANWMFTSNVSWQLTEIYLPNSGGSITFNYDYSIEPDYIYGMEDAAVKMSYERPFHPINNLYCGRGIEIINCNLIPTREPYNYKMKLLSSISGSDFDIFLDYQNPQQQAAHNCVKKIRIEETVGSIEVDLAMYEDAPNLVKLESVTIKNPSTSDKPQIYRCTYPGIWGFTGIDHWGFSNFGRTDIQIANFNLYVPFDVVYHRFNGNGVTAINKSPQDPCPYYKIKLLNSNQNYDHRAPALPDQHGVLSRLEFPTGGYTDFEFENHQFLSSTGDNGDYIHDSKEKVSKPAGGFRIKKITNYDSNGKVAEMKNFRYGKTYFEAREDNNKFAYMALQRPNIHTGVGEAVVDPNILTYMNYRRKMLGSTSIVREMVLGLHNVNEFDTNLLFKDECWYWECEFSSANFRKLLNGRPPVIYPEVTVYYGEIGDDYYYTPEKTTGKTVYKYDFYDCRSDNYDHNTSTVPCHVFFECPVYYGHTLAYESKSYRYNNLKEKIDYRIDGQSYEPINREKNDWRYESIRIKDYQYTNPYTLYYDYYPSDVRIFEFFKEKWTYYGTALLQSRTITSYTSAGDSLITLEEYGYNRGDDGSKNLLGSKQIANSEGKGIITFYEYPEINSNGTTPDVIRNLVNRNMLATVIEQKTEAWPSGKVIAGYKIDYKQFPSGIYPEKLYELKDATSVLSTEVLSYKGNRPQEVVTQDGVHTVYLWRGYDYLMAEIKNATLAQVSNAVQGIFGTSIDNANLQDITKLNSLRNNSNLSNALVTTYTYGSWRKVTSITDPHGVTVTYEYDGFGRLKTIKDANGKKVEEYEYNYTN